MEFLIGLLVGVFLVGTINFIIALLEAFDLIKMSVSHAIFIGSGWAWLIVIEPIRFLVFKIREWWQNR